MTPADLVKLARAAKSGKKVTSGLSAAKEAATISNMQQAGELPLSAAEMKAAKDKFLSSSQIKDRLYHGTGDDIKEFRNSRIGAMGPGTYLAESPQNASHYANVTTRKGSANQPNVMPVYVQTKNPFVISDVNKSHEELFKYFDPEGKLTDDEVIKKVLDAGYDSIYAKSTGEVNVLDPKKIKSATGNRGTYNIEDADINKAKGGLAHMAGGGKARTRAGTIAQPTFIDEQIDRTRDRLSKLYNDPDQALRDIARQYFPSSTDTPEEQQQKLEDLSLGFAGNIKTPKAPKSPPSTGGDYLPGVHYADPLQAPTMKMSEALGNVGAEGKTLRFTEADRSRVFGPNRGGVGFSALQHYSIPHKEARTVWGYGNESTARKKINQNDPNSTIWSTYAGSPTQHKSNTVVVKDAIKTLQDANKAGAVNPEQIKLINYRIQRAVNDKGKPLFPEGFDITDPKALSHATTFDRRSVISDALMGVGVKKPMRSVVFKEANPGVAWSDASNIENILARETDPALVNANTFDVGPHLFTIENQVIHRPDLNKAFPYQVTGEDLGMRFEPTPFRLAAPEFTKDIPIDEVINAWKMSRSNPSQFVSEEYLTKLQKKGRAKGGLIHMAGGGTPEPKRKSILDLTPLTEAAAAVQNAFRAESGTYRDKGAAMDILNRGIVADTLGGAADLANLPLQGLDWLQSKIPGLSKPASVMDVPSTSPRLSDQPNTTLKFPLSTDAPFGGSEAWKELFKKSGVTSKTERPVAEISTSLLAPFAPAVASKAAKVAKAVAPRAGDLASQFAAKQAEAMGLPLELGIVPEGGPKLSKAAMMREKYASQNVAKEAKKAVTFADIAPKEVKVPADNLGLYSPAQKAAANLKRNIGTGEAFLSDIKKAPDVTAEELKLSGVEDWLKSKKTASRQEVQDYMAKNRPKLEEAEYQQGAATEDELKFGEGRVIDETDEYINSRADDIANDWDSIGWKSRDEIREEILSEEDPERAQYLVESGQIDDLVNDRVYALAFDDAHNEYYERPYREFTNDLGYRIFGNDDVGYSIQDPRQRDITPNRGAYDIETAEGVVRQHAMGNGIVTGGETKFHDYQLEGGDNYREILIKAPDTKSGERNRLYAEINNEIYNIGHRSNNASPEQLLEDEKRLQELYEKRRSISTEEDKANANRYESSHWGEPNVVAHLRLQDRVDADGKKVLYVDEMQSDWHQEGAEYGYKSADHEAQVKENRNAIANLRNQAEYLRAEKEDLITKLHEKHRDLGHVHVRQHALQLDEVKKYDADLLALKKQQDALSDEYKNLSNAVPEGPYKDNWHELALKRVMNYAAKNGYERVAFSSSKPQVGRWGTESIAFEKSEMGGLGYHQKALYPFVTSDAPVWKVSATAQRGGRAGHIELEAEARARGILNEKQPEIIQSKDELRNIVSAIASRGWTNAKIDRVTNKTWKRMQEESVGVVEPRREGMEEFYDRTLGNSINKYAKKYKGKVGDVQIPVKGSESHSSRYIDITPEMQKSLLKGQPMKRGGAVRMANGGAVTEGGSVPKAPSNWTDYLSQHAQEESMRLMGGDTALNPMKDGGSIDDMIRKAVTIRNQNA